MKNTIQSWESIYKSGNQLSEWPWTDLVALVSKFVPENVGVTKKKVLELGPGVGANIPFFMRKGWDYFAVEGSATATKLLLEKFPHLAQSIKRADFTSDIPFDETFDLIVDRCSVPFNSEKEIASTLSLLASKTRIGALYIGIDWFSDDDFHAKLGTAVDESTRSHLPPGPFAESGDVNFSSEKSISEKFMKHNFKMVYFEKLVSQKLFPHLGEPAPSFNFVAIKMARDSSGTK